MKFIYMLCVLIGLTGCAQNTFKRLSPENLFSVAKPLDYLTRSTYRSLIIEAIPVEGCIPSSGDLESLLEAAKLYCDKPNGVTYVVDPPISQNIAPLKVWNDNDLFQFESKYSQLHTHGDVLVLHLLYVHGGFIKDPNHISAESIGPTTIGFFYEEFSHSPTSTVTNHEFFHALGLVSNGTPMVRDHEDHNNPGHCSDINCLMYFRSDVGNQTDLCINCKADLAAGR